MTLLLLRGSSQTQPKFCYSCLVPEPLFWGENSLRLPCTVTAAVIGAQEQSPTILSWPPACYVHQAVSSGRWNWQAALLDIFQNSNTILWMKWTHLWSQPSKFILEVTSILFHALSCFLNIFLLQDVLSPVTMNFFYFYNFLFWMKWEVPYKYVYICPLCKFMSACTWVF